MDYTRDELSQFNLQKLASLYPQTLEQENLIKEVFEQRASVSNYNTLTSMVDVKAKWQEEIIQKYVDLRRETMALENPAVLSEADEAELDPGVITKEKELALQAKLDKKNGRLKKMLDAEDASVEPEEVTELQGGGTIDEEGNIESTPVEVISVKKVKKSKT